MRFERFNSFVLDDVKPVYACPKKGCDVHGTSKKAVGCCQKKTVFAASPKVSQQYLGQGECGAAVCIKGSVGRVAKPAVYLAQGWPARPKKKVRV